MKKFSFIVLMSGNADLPSGAIIDCEALAWDELVINEHFTGDAFDVASLKAFLQTAYCMYGHTFNTENHSPKQLYEALISNDKYRVMLEGEIPANPLEYEDLPDEACD